MLVRFPICVIRPEVLALGTQAAYDELAKC